MLSTKRSISKKNITLKVSEPPLSLRSLVVIHYKVLKFTNSKYQPHLNHLFVYEEGIVAKGVKISTDQFFPQKN